MNFKVARFLEKEQFGIAVIGQLMLLNYRMVPKKSNYSTDRNLVEMNEYQQLDINVTHQEKR